METLLFPLFLAFLAVCVLLNLISLPGNWIMAGSVAVYVLLSSSAHPGLPFFLMFFGMFAFGEISEFYFQLHGAKTGGASRRSTWLGMAGALLGALLCAPVLFGLGAIPGALFGAFGACYLSERMIGGRPAQEAMRAAKSTLAGRVTGMVIKFGAGIAMVCLAATSL